MDFSSVKEITIPEGAVSKIVNSSGAVLWEGGIADESFTFHVETRNTLSPVTVPRGSTWRDAAAIYNTSVGVNNRYKFVIVEDDLWGDSVVIEYYYSGTRSETILDVKPDDVINQPYYSTF